jgi:hypothetical protein
MPFFRTQDLYRIFKLFFTFHKSLISWNTAGLGEGDVGFASRSVAWGPGGLGTLDPHFCQHGKANTRSQEQIHIHSASDAFRDSKSFQRQRRTGADSQSTRQSVHTFTCCGHVLTCGTSSNSAAGVAVTTYICIWEVSGSNEAGIAQSI